MPRPLHHGRPGSRIIPTTWQQQNAPVVTNILTGSGCAVTITAPGGHAAWNDETNQTETVPNTPVYGPDVTPYAGAADIILMSDTDRDITVVDELATSRLYEVHLPWDAPVACNRVGNVIKVTENPDAALVGRTLTVQSAELDTARFSRVLYATLID